MVEPNDLAAEDDVFAEGIAEEAQAEEAQADLDSRLDAFALAVDAELGELVRPLIAEVAAGQTIAIDLRSDLGLALANFQLDLERDRDAIVAVLQRVADAQTISLAIEAAALRDIALPPALIITSSATQSALQIIVAQTQQPTGDTDVQLWRDAADALEIGGARIITGCVSPRGIAGVAWSGLGLYVAACAAPGGIVTGSARIDPSTPEANPLPNPDPDFTHVAIMRWALLNPPAEAESLLFLTGPDFRTASGCIELPACPIGAEPLPAPLVETPAIPGLPPVVVPAPAVRPPDTPDVFCPPSPELVVALDCDARVLVVRVAEEVAADPQFIVLGDARDEAEFDLAAILDRCEPTLVERVKDVVLPETDESTADDTPELFTDCDLTPWIIHPDLSAPRRARKIAESAVVGSAIKGALRRIPGLADAPVIEIGRFNLLRDLEKEAVKVFDQWNVRCNQSDKHLRFANERALLIALNGNTPGLMDEFIISADQHAKQSCPSRMPTIGDALSTWLSAAIDDDEFKCWVESQGFTFKHFQHVASAARAKPNLNESIGMMRRGIIDPERLFRQSREIGFTKSQDVENLIRLSEQIPGPSDITRMMVRDAADDVNIDWTQSDASFVQKFTGPLEKWARWQAIPTEAMKFQWRSHWEIPPATQLFTMMHRIGRNPDGSPVPGFRDRVKRALQQNDLMPDWVDDVIDINFRLPRRADLRRVFRVGIFSEADLLGEFVKQGLETKTAEGLVEFEIREKKRAFANNPLVAKYSRGEINADELFDELGELGADPDGLRTALNRGKLLMRMRRRSRCLEAIRHRVLVGEIDRAESERLAQLQTMDIDQATELAETWQCERDSRSKSVSAAELCKWYKDNVIDAAQFVRQLREIGFSRELAEAKFQQCQLELNRKLSAAQERARRREQALADKSARDSAGTVKQSEKAQAARIKNLLKARAATDRREKKVVDAARTLANRTDLSFDDTLAAMMRFYRSQLRLALIDADELAAAVLAAAKIKSVSGLDSWMGRVESIIDVVA